MYVQLCSTNDETIINYPIFLLQLLQQASAAGNLGTLAGLGNLGGAAAGNGNNCYFMALQKTNRFICKREKQIRSASEGR